eukprot:m.190200 g.190200  ORF g.190200 m.190200 type:complete len:317 (+) comp39430_c0_seq58:62-1012(+)
MALLVLVLSIGFVLSANTGFDFVNDPSRTDSGKKYLLPHGCGGAISLCSTNQAASMQLVEKKTGGQHKPGDGYLNLTQSNDRELILFIRDKDFDKIGYLLAKREFFCRATSLVDGKKIETEIFTFVQGGIPVFESEFVDTLVCRNQKLDLHFAVARGTEPTPLVNCSFQNATGTFMVQAEPTMNQPSSFSRRQFNMKTNGQPGLYQCQASNRYGVVLSKPAMLTVSRTACPSSSVDVTETNVSSPSSPSSPSITLQWSDTSHGNSSITAIPQENSVAAWKVAVLCIVALFCFSLCCLGCRLYFHASKRSKRETLEE